MEEAKLTLNMDAPEGGLPKDVEFAGFSVEDIKGVPPSSSPGPSNSWGGPSSSYPSSIGTVPQDPQSPFPPGGDH